MIGRHPPLQFFEAFYQRISNGKVDKVWQMKPGIFMVKFMHKKQREKAIERGMVFFDNKPVIVKAWKQNMNFDEPESVPIWVKFPGLDMVYWEPSILCRIASTLGIPLRVDGATWEMDKTRFARVLVEMKIGDNLPASIPFIDEKEVIQHQKVEYEWKPIKCNKCNLIGHQMEECNREERLKKERQADERRNNIQSRHVSFQARQNVNKQRQVYVAVGKKVPEHRTQQVVHTAEKKTEMDQHREGKEPMGNASVPMLQRGDTYGVININEDGNEDEIRPPKEPMVNEKVGVHKIPPMQMKNTNGGNCLNLGGNEVQRNLSFVYLSDPPDDDDEQ